MSIDPHPKNLKFLTRGAKVGIGQTCAIMADGMRVLILSKASIVGEYQTKLTALAQQPGIELVVVVPPAWQDARGRMALEKAHTAGYELSVTPIRMNGHFHLHYYPELPKILARVQPDLVHIDEEPYNLASYLAARALARQAPHARLLFFSWQNIYKYYPPPFGWMECYLYQVAAAAIAGSYEAKAVLERKGFGKPIAVIPQFGVPDSFVPGVTPHASNCIVIGYAGRLVREKGIQVLLRALAAVHGTWELRILGSGPLYDSLASMARELGIEARVHFSPWAASDQMPGFYQSLDMLVVPSLTRPNWKEQFGRVIMEAMACGVPVIGSDSGEIPNVVGDAGIVVPEGDVAALARAIDQLIQYPAERLALGAKGRARAVGVYSQQRVVSDTYALYRSLDRANSRTNQFSHAPTS